MRWLRIGLCALVVFGVLSFGAVQVWSESVLEIGAAALFLAWALVAYRSADAAVQWNPLNWPILGFLAIGMVQLATRTTAYAFLTWTELLLVATYFLIFFLAAQAFRTRADFAELGWFLILFCFAISLFGIVQHFTSASEIYWRSDLKIAGSPFGPYVNRNDFAGFVELTLPVGLALMMFRGVKRDVFPFLTVLTIVPISALVLSTSRGGIMSAAVGVGVLVVLAWSRRGLMPRGSRRVAAVSIVALAALTLVAWVGAGAAIHRFAALKSPDVTFARRLSMTRGALNIFLDHPIAGSGLGTLIAVFPRYETQYDGKIVDHVHNDYAEALAETGVVGGICGLAFLWLFYREARKSFLAEQGHLSRALHAAGIAAVCALLLHSFVDFNLHIPANAVLFLLQVYVATSPPVSSQGSAPRFRKRVRESRFASA